MITSLVIKNFKSMQDFSISGLGKFVCLIGVNGSGKSTLLQALDFLHSAFLGESEFRDWGHEGISTVSSKMRDLHFEIGARLSDGVDLVWSGDFDISKWRFVFESVVSDGRELMSCDGHRFVVQDGTPPVLSDVSDAAFFGSVMSTRKFESAPHLRAFKELVLGVKSLELLAPDELRKVSRLAAELDVGGRGLPGYLEQLGADSKDLSKTLKSFYPHFIKTEKRKPGPGWYGFAIEEKYDSAKKTDMRHVNDGLLRLLAILGQRYSKQKVILFDEIENGINQELVGKLVETLVDGFPGQQIIVTTHSALVLNYLSDESVRESVIFLYRNRFGFTKACKFFELPEMAHKLDSMNAGQVMADTDLIALADELSSKEE